MSDDRDGIDPGFYVDPPPTRARRMNPDEIADYGEGFQAWLATIPPGWDVWVVEAQTD